MKRKPLAILICIGMILTLMPTTVYADTEVSTPICVDIYDGDIEITSHTATNGVSWKITQNGTTTCAAVNNKNLFVVQSVPGATGHTITVDGIASVVNLGIYLSPDNNTYSYGVTTYPVNISAAGNALNLKNNAVVTLIQDSDGGDPALRTTSTTAAAIHVPAGCQLTINGITDNSNLQTVIYQEYGYGAAIGGNEGEDCGTVIINEGTVDASAKYGAGIGGGGNSNGNGGNGGTVNINGGNGVSARSDKGAAIGGGYGSTTGGSGGSVTVGANGKVTNTDSNYGAAIGGGSGGTTGGSGGTVTIENGAEIEINACNGGAAIGGGSGGTAGGSSGTVYINGGNLKLRINNVPSSVTAFGAFIGNGSNATGELADAGTVIMASDFNYEWASSLNFGWIDSNAVYTLATSETPFFSNDGSKRHLFIRPAGTYTITANPANIDFGSASSGYTTPAAQTITINNTGDRYLELSQPVVSSADYEITPLSPTFLDYGDETATFTVQPKSGLGNGDHNATITVNGSNGATATVPVSFHVGSSGTGGSHGGGSGGSGQTTPALPSTVVSDTTSQITVGNSGSASIPASDVKNLAESKKPVEVANGSNSFTVPAEVFTENAQEAITIVVVKADSAIVNKAQAALAKDEKAAQIGGADNSVCISLKAGSTAVGTFKSPARISTKLSANTLKTVKDINHLTFARVNDDGTLTYIGGKYDAATGMFTANTDVTGNFILVEKGDIKKITLSIGSTDINVNGWATANDVAPVIIENRTMMPLRFIAEAFGASVGWTQSTKTVDVNINDQTLTMQINVEIPGYGIGPILKDNRTLVPIRYISEKLDAHVLWLPDTKEIEIVK